MEATEFMSGMGGGDSDGLRDQNINLAPTGGKKKNLPPLWIFFNLENKMP